MKLKDKKPWKIQSEWERASKKVKQTEREIVQEREKERESNWEGERRDSNSIYTNCLSTILDSIKGSYKFYKWNATLMK